LHSLKHGPCEGWHALRRRSLHSARVPHQRAYAHRHGTMQHTPLFCSSSSIALSSIQHRRRHHCHHSHYHRSTVVVVIIIIINIRIIIDPPSSSSSSSSSFALSSIHHRRRHRHRLHYHHRLIMNRMRGTHLGGWDKSYDDQTDEVDIGDAMELLKEIDRQERQDGVLGCLDKVVREASSLQRMRIGNRE
jgi:hypothetical protein